MQVRYTPSYKTELAGEPSLESVLRTGRAVTPLPTLCLTQSKRDGSAAAPVSHTLFSAPGTAAMVKSESLDVSSTVLPS